MHRPHVCYGSCHVTASKDILKVAGDIVAESTLKTGGWLQRFSRWMVSMIVYFHPYQGR